MTYKLSQQEFRSVQSLPADQRYQHLISKVAEEGEVWSLRSKEGWVVVTSEGDDCFPVWPHPDYAAAWATGDWSDCTPQAIKLDVWMERWLPGMEVDGTLLAVFPNEDEEGVVVTPPEMEDSLREALR